MTDFTGLTWRNIAIVVAAQLGVLAYMVWDRVTLLTQGREVTVDVVPVDPRDVFRGDYVVLSYPFSRTTLETGAEQWLLPKGARVAAPVYVTLAPDEAQSWKRVGVSLSRPAAVEPSHVVLKGRVSQVWKATQDSTAMGTAGQGTAGQGMAGRGVTSGSAPADGMQGHVLFGIESYFVPEGTGLELEKLVRDKKIRAVLAVGDDGTPALKALEVEGKRIHEQPAL